MKSIFTVLQDFEKLIYKILMWVILIPKTIVYVVLDPLDASEYVTEELRDDKDSPFDEFISPVILLLVAALLPALAFNFLPKYGSVISSPAETKPTTDRFLSFEAQTDFKSASTDMTYVHTWTIEKVQSDGSYPEIYNEVHPQNAESFESVDANTVKDRFLYTFDSAGDYYINVFVDKIDLPADKFQLEQDYNWASQPIVESQNSYLTVSVPVRQDEPILISNSSTKGNAEAEKSKGVASFSESIKDEKTIFLALALMLPPLLFAFATKLYKKRDPNSQDDTEKSSYVPSGEEISEISPYIQIGEETLKNNFYVQCYYFSPLSLAIWGTYYASYFYTEDAFLFSKYDRTWQIILVPVVLCIMWFLRTEVKYIVKARGTTTFRAIVITLTSLLVLGLGANAIFSFADLQDLFRLWAIRIYPVAAILLVLAFGYAWYKRRQKHKEPIMSGNGAGLLTVIILFFGVMNFIPYILNVASQPPGAVADQPTDIAVAQATAVADVATTQIVEVTPTLAVDQSTPTLIAETPTLAPSPYYTEEFNGDIASWFDFMSSGDQRMVDKRVELGKLSVHLLQLEDKLPWYYLINNNFTYSDVKVEAVVTNRGNNANGVSLICRYSDIGWYEFVLSNGGTYNIYAVDSTGIVDQGYNLISTGGSPVIKNGQSTNVYTIVCNGSDLSLLVNQKLVRTVTDKRFKFAEGKIGLAFTSPNKLPIKVEIESLTVSEP